MIVATRLSGSPFAINPDLIERIVENPDTTIFLVDGSSHIVTEPLTRILELIADSRADVIARASLRRIELSPGQRHLEALRPAADVHDSPFAPRQTET